MSTYEAQRPVHRVRCDHEGCEAEYEAISLFSQRSGHSTRYEAGDAGWDVPPVRGKGSRRDTDFCPQHANGGA